MADLIEPMGFFMSRENNSNAGMSIIELVVALGIFGILAAASYRMYGEFTEQQWSARNQVVVKQEVSPATAAINKYFPGAIVLNSPDNPVADTNTWQCSGGACSLRSDNRQNGIELLTSCESTQGNNILKRLSFEKLGTLSEADNCAICRTGERPTLEIIFYSAGTASGRMKYPKQPASSLDLKGLVGMSICFSVPPRTTPDGDAFDQWVISLVPVYFSRIPKGSDSDDQLQSKFVSVRESLMLGPMEQLGSKIKVIK